MKKTTILLATILFSTLVAISQTKQNLPAKDATFCGKIGESGATGGTYTVKELRNCEFKIVPLDSNLTVVTFQMSLVAKEKSFPYTEKKITGNVIPAEYKNQILTQTKNVFLEQIKAVNKKGQQELIKPIAVRIQ